MKYGDKWEFRYSVQNAEGEWVSKKCYPTSKENVKVNREICKERGYRVDGVQKLYCFNTNKNQHNFELIHNIAMIELYEIWDGEKQATDEEIERLEHLRDRTEYFFCQPLPMAWLTWDEWKEANEIAQNAIVHRQNACIEAGRYDLIQYC